MLCRKDSKDRLLHQYDDDLPQDPPGRVGHRTGRLEAGRRHRPVLGHSVVTSFCLAGLGSSSRTAVRGDMDGCS